MSWLKKIRDKDVDKKTTILNEYEELQKQYIFKCCNLAEEFYMKKPDFFFADADPIKGLTNFIEAETEIRDRLIELKQKNKEND